MPILFQNWTKAFSIRLRILPNCISPRSYRAFNGISYELVARRW